MATKVIVIGQEEIKPKLKAISLVKYVDSGFTIKNNEIKASAYNFIELICRNYSEGYDILLCYQQENKRSDGVLFFGHFNDGVVE